MRIEEDPMRILEAIYHGVQHLFNWCCDTDIISDRTKGIILAVVVLALCLTDQP